MGRALGETLDLLRGRRRIYYGWWVLVASMVIVGVTNGVSFWSFGLIITPLEGDFGWSRASVSLGISLSLLVSGLMAPLVGRWSDRYGPRRSILWGAVVSAVTYVLLATTTEVWQWHVYMMLNGVARHFMFIIPVMSLTSRWFERRRSLAVAIVGVGLFGGAMVMVPLMRVLIDVLSWNGMFLAIAVLLLAVHVPLALFVVRDHPSDVGAAMDGDVLADGEAEPARPLTGVPLTEALRSPIFWAITSGLMLFVLGMVTWLVHAVPFYESVGMSPGWAAGLTSITAGGGIVSRLVAGRMADRFPKYEYVGMAACLVLGLSTVVLLIDTSPLMIALFLLLFVSAFGVSGAMLETLLLTRAFGVRFFATIYGVVMLLNTVGMLVGPTTAGAIFDATGSYSWALVMMLAMFVGAAVLFMVASRLPRPIDALASVP